MRSICRRVGSIITDFWPKSVNRNRSRIAGLLSATMASRRLIFRSTDFSLPPTPPGDWRDWVSRRSQYVACHAPFEMVIALSPSPPPEKGGGGGTRIETAFFSLPHCQVYEPRIYSFAVLYPSPKGKIFYRPRSCNVMKSRTVFWQRSRFSYRTFT